MEAARADRVQRRLNGCVRLARGSSQRSQRRRSTPTVPASHRLPSSSVVSIDQWASSMKRASAKQTRARGSEGALAKFAPRFLRGRLDGFQKDMKTCLTGIPNPKRRGKETHAYFPALMACCGMLEYMACLYRGPSRNTRNTFIASWRDIAGFPNRFVPGVYDEDAVRILHESIRNAVAHRSILSGVWVDEDKRNAGRRLVWSIYEDFDGLAIQIEAHSGTIRRDSLWECPYTHRVHVRLGTLSNDISEAINAYIAELECSADLQNKFERCLRYLYPIDASYRVSERGNAGLCEQPSLERARGYGNRLFPRVRGYGRKALVGPR